MQRRKVSVPRGGFRKAIEADSRVDFIDDETRYHNGYWVYLRRGWTNTQLECASIHEMTLADCYAVLMTYVTPSDEN